MQVDVADVRIWFDVDGAKERVVSGSVVNFPTLVVLHGGPGADHFFSKGWGPALADVAQVVYPDLRGHGRSSASDRSRWNLATWADDIAEFCRVLGIERPIVLGTSFGGFVAQAIATRHPALASKLVLCSTAARMDIEASVANFGRLGGAGAEKAARNFFAHPSDKVAAQCYVETCMPLYSARRTRGMGDEIKGARWTPELFEWFANPDAGEMRRFDFRPQLRYVTAPTLILAGSSDPLMPARFAEELVCAFAPGTAQLRFLENASHSLFTDRPEQYLSLLKDFIRDA